VSLVLLQIWPKGCISCLLLLLPLLLLLLRLVVACNSK